MLVFEASREITTPSSVHHLTEAHRFINKAGVFRWKGKAGGFDLIIINVKHFVPADGEMYSGVCTT